MFYIRAKQNVLIFDFIRQLNSLNIFKTEMINYSENFNYDILIFYISYYDATKLEQSVLMSIIVEVIILM